MDKKISNKTKIKLKIEELERQSNLIKSELEDELSHTKEKVTDLGKVALGIGGGLVFVLLILSRIPNRKNISNKSGEKLKPKKVYQRFRNQLARELASQATSFLLGVATDKLGSMVNNKEREEHVDS